MLSIYMMTYCMCRRNPRFGTARFTSGTARQWGTGEGGHLQCECSLIEVLKTLLFYVGSCDNMTKITQGCHCTVWSWYCVVEKCLDPLVLQVGPVSTHDSCDILWWQLDCRLSRILLLRLFYQLDCFSKYGNILNININVTLKQ